MLPQLTPATDLGAVALSGYAKRDGLEVAAFLERFGRTLSSEDVGNVIVDMAADAAYDRTAYLVTPSGLTPAP